MNGERILAIVEKEWLDMRKNKMVVIMMALLPILMVGMLGYALSSLLFGLSTQLWMLFASRALSGLLSSATLGTAMAYISDSTSEEDRGSGIGMLGAAAGLGVIIGPGVGGWLGADSLSMPFFIAAGFARKRPFESSATGIAALKRISSQKFAVSHEGAKSRPPFPLAMIPANRSTR